MKRKLLTLALLATVAVGGAFAGNFKLDKVSKKLDSQYEYYQTQGPNCIKITCDDQFTGSLCSVALVGDVYENDDCTGSVTLIQGRLPE